MKLKDLVQQLGDISVNVKFEDYETVFGNSTSVIQDVPVKKVVIDHKNQMVILL